ncbi:MAG TPA: hypothetical protein VFT49_01410 [Candidatus Saccharimonadales bacterium]|nr:hypothetical protein [Candidatus Saccharimonadales bacterium]
MQNPSGTFIVIEGADGSGKSTQFNILKARLEAIGHEVDVFKFPQHHEPSGYFVHKYLNGGYGPIDKISPYTASLFYALDRFEGAPAIRQSMQSGHIALSDRYVGANMAHQGSKFTNPAEQRGFFVWEDGLEFELLNIPRPTLTIFLHVPAEISQRLLAERAKKTGVALDEHEKNVEHLRTTVSTYEKLCQLFPNDFKLVDCTENGKLLSVPQINNKIWDVVKPILPDKPSKPAHSVTVKLNETAQSKSAPKTDTSEVPKKAVKEAVSTKLSLAAILEARLAGLDIQPELDWSKAGYEYFKPQDLPKKTAAKYEQFMEGFVVFHRAMKGKLKKTGASEALLYDALPLAAQFEVKVPLPENEQGLLEQFSGSQNVELRQLAGQLNGNSKSKASVRDSNPPESIDKILARIAGEHLPQALAQQPETVELVEAQPRNEFKVLADVLYPYSNLPKLDLEAEIDQWGYQQKTKALETALKNSPSEVMPKLQYRFDLTLDYRLLSHVVGLVKDIKLQPATPRYGYDVPHAVDEAGITEEYLECFDKSLELFSTLQAASRDDLAVYATLTGHENRCHVTCSLADLKTIKDKSLSSELNQLIDQLLEKISEHHPIAAASLGEQLSEEAPKSARKKRPRRRGGKSKKS